MRRPRFKLDGRSVTLRWKKPDGRTGLQTDRGIRLMTKVAVQVVAGTGKDFEARKAGYRGRTAWHPVSMTYEEAVEYLDAYWMTRGLLRNAKATREFREERGMPTFLT